jgi:sugar/nucleoside kinase (ribokinase family)
MHAAPRVVSDSGRVKRFDVICAGETQWKIADPPSSSSPMRLRPGGGAVNVALALAREGLRVGLATVLVDDELGRGSLERIAAARIDVEGITLASPRAGLALLDASGRPEQLSLAHSREMPLEVPVGWSSQVMLLSGLSPVVPHAAALCKAARAARRAGALVALDFNASLHVWAGRDPRTVRMILREVDVARCSYSDLAVLGVDVASARASLRESAVLIVSDARGGASAAGPFGEVTFVPRDRSRLRLHGAGDAFTAGVCRELTRPREPGASPAAFWDAVLRRGYAASSAG